MDNLPFHLKGEYWCADCDEVCVSTDSLEHGRVFIHCAHEVDDMNEWPRVIYSLCWDCLMKRATK